MIDYVSHHVGISNSRRHHLQTGLARLKFNTEPRILYTYIYVYALTATVILTCELKKKKAEIHTIFRSQRYIVDDYSAEIYIWKVYQVQSDTALTRPNQKKAIKETVIFVSITA